jgi:formylglycine-generating enzyme required for sulfatase activity
MRMTNITKLLLIVLMIVMVCSCDNPVFENPMDSHTALQTPLNLTLDGLTETSAWLHWKDLNFNSNYPHAQPDYDIEVSSDGVNYRVSKTVKDTYTEINEIFLRGKSYSFRVKAKNSSRASAYSNLVIASLAFPAPSNVQVTSLTDTSAIISWQNNCTMTTAFEIYLGTDSTNIVLVKTESAATTVSTITRAFDSTALYYFYVRAMSTYNRSDYSAPVLAGPLQYPFVMDMVFVKGGAFQMGGTNQEELPIHNVTLTSFSLGKYEVTQRQWKNVVQWKQGSATTPLHPDPSSFHGEYLPVEKVNWNDIQIWIGYLNEKEGTNKYRLPTEAEWEFAARGGLSSTGYTFSGSNKVEDVAWYIKNADNTRHIVGTRKANELGIYDMSGNAWEWCGDWYAPYTSPGQTNPAGPATGTYRVLRGGSSTDDSSVCRVAFRNYYAPSLSSSNFGFRLVKDN